LEILTFELSGHRFGVPLRSVREVVRVVAITPVPGAPDAVEGIIDVRGEIVAVFDLRARFGLEARPIWPTQHLVIAVAAGRTVAFRVDRVDWMVVVDDASIQDPGQVVVGARHIAGVGKLEDGLVLIHDLDGFLTQAEGEALDQALAERAG
jgi:purine-binding chemotaxis protein CheW